MPWGFPFHHLSPLSAHGKISDFRVLQPIAYTNNTFKSFGVYFSVGLMLISVYIYPPWFSVSQLKNGHHNKTSWCYHKNYKCDNTWNMLSTLPGISWALNKSWQELSSHVNPKLRKIINSYLAILRMTRFTFLTKGNANPIHFASFSLSSETSIF